MVYPDVVQQTTPYCTKRPAGGKEREVRGVVLHHTGGSTAVAPHAGGSWHYLIDRDGTVYAPVALEDVAWHAARTDRWRPAWVARTCTWADVSDINTCTIGIELVSPGGPSATFTDEQYHAVTSIANVLGDKVWWVGHGEFQSDRRPLEPEGFDWERAGFGEKDPQNGRQFMGKAVSQEELDLLEVLRQTNYPIVEIIELVKMFSGLKANHSSVEDWINKIGALEQLLEEKGDGASGAAE